MAFYTSSPLGLLVDPLNDISYDEKDYGKSYKSIFSSYSGKDKQIFKNTNGGGGGSFQVTPILSSSPHKSEIYDVSTSNVIEKLNGLKHMQLSYADFAYLKNFGVYPNNRLFIARRYPQPVVDDLYSVSSNKTGYPLSTVIGYLPTEDEDFIKLSFNEEWTNSEVSFTNILNDIGKDFGFNLGGGLGSILEGAVNVVPLPGATLLLQRKLMAALGLFGNNVGFDETSGTFKKIERDDKGNFKAYGEVVQTSTIPQGDPNLIKEAMNRTLIGENEPGAGVKCKVSITLKTTYEQKFINNVDPSKVFMDILNNCLNMGTSPATFYLGKQVDAANNFASFMEEFMNDPLKKIQEFITSLIDAFKSQLDILDKNMKDSGKQKGFFENVNDKLFGSNEKENEPSITNVLKDAISSVPGYVKDFIRAKYKVKFMGIINALTGGPSTPWHITIGNPLRPIFCSGDMLCKNVTVNFGPQLSFNDLPTYIEVQVDLESARNLGLQEIFAKFNAGGIRAVDGTNTSAGTYGTSSPGPLSFWNVDNYKLQMEQDNSDQKQKTSQESNQVDDLENTTNKRTEDIEKGQESKVLETPTGSNITPSTTSDLQCNPDANSDTPIIPSGTDANTQTIRTDTTQESTGDTEGFTDQKQNPDDIPYTGENSNPIQQETKTGVVKAITEEVEIVSGPPVSYIVTGTYDVDGKQVIGKGVDSKTYIARLKAKADALKKSK
jgi:hypothetical protein